MTLQTTNSDGHTHVATVDWAGNGITDPGPKDGHVHNIKSYDVKPAGNGHIHSIREMLQTSGTMRRGSAK